MEAYHVTKRGPGAIIGIYIPSENILLRTYTHVNGNDVNRPQLDTDSNYLEQTKKAFEKYDPSNPDKVISIHDPFYADWRFREIALPDETVDLLLPEFSNLHALRMDAIDAKTKVIEKEKELAKSLESLVGFSLQVK